MMVNLPCLKGSVSQLPSSHLSIHRVPAKLSNRVMPYGENYRQLQLLFLIDSTDLPLIKDWYTVDAILVLVHWSFLWYSASTLHHDYRVSFPEPGSISVFSGIQQGSGIVILFRYYAACVSCWAGLTISDNNFFGSYTVPFVSIV